MVYLGISNIFNYYDLLNLFIYGNVAQTCLKEFIAILPKFTYGWNQCQGLSVNQLVWTRDESWKQSVVDMELIWNGKYYCGEEIWVGTKNCSW